MRNDDDLWLAHAKDKLRISEKRYEPQFTGFCERTKATVFPEGKVWGGYEQAERVMLGFFPEYLPDDNSLFPITAVEISYNPNYGKSLAHRDFLGSVTGLGIVREKIGDIIVSEGSAVMFVCSDIADYIITNLERVGHTSVKVKITEDIPDVEKGGVEKTLTISSLRLDNFVSTAFNISRTKSAELIKGKKTFINHIEALNVSKIISQGDTVTLRGFGRVRLVSVDGRTKKDKILITICKYC
jgi:RNA-binding protein YlmH